MCVVRQIVSMILVRRRGQISVLKRFATMSASHCTGAGRTITKWNLIMNDFISEQRRMRIAGVMEERSAPSLVGETGGYAALFRGPAC